MNGYRVRELPHDDNENGPTMATTNDLKNGMTLDLDGQLWNVVEFQHVKPGKGGAFVRTTLKNVLSGKVVDKTFNAGTKVEIANVDKREMQYLYQDGDDYVFMDAQTYDQIHDPGRGRRLQPRLPAREHDGDRRDARRAPRCTSSCPTSVELIITQTDPGLQGDRSTGGTKPATLETGATIQVPLFITTGEKVKVDTRDRRLPRPGQELTDLDARSQQGTQARARRPLRGRLPRRRRGHDAGRPAAPSPTRRSRPTPSSWSRAWSPTASASTS